MPGEAPFPAGPPPCGRPPCVLPLPRWREITGFGKNGRIGRARNAACGTRHRCEQALCGAEPSGAPAARPETTESGGFLPSKPPPEARREGRSGQARLVGHYAPNRESAHTFAFRRFASHRFVGAPGTATFVIIMVSASSAARRPSCARGMGCRGRRQSRASSASIAAGTSSIGSTSRAGCCASRSSRTACLVSSRSTT